MIGKKLRRKSCLWWADMKAPLGCKNYYQAILLFFRSKGRMASVIYRQTSRYIYFTYTITLLL